MKEKIMLKTGVRDGVEQADQKEFLEAARRAGKSFCWALLNVPTRRAGQDWPRYSRAAAKAVGADLP